jgi:hypothetical protein
MVAPDFTELALAGDVRAVRGMLPAAPTACRSGARILVGPQADLAEAALVPDLRVAGGATLGQVGEGLVGRADWADPAHRPIPGPQSRTWPRCTGRPWSAAPSRSPSGGIGNESYLELWNAPAGPPSP